MGCTLRILAESVGLVGWLVGWLLPVAPMVGGVGGLEIQNTGGRTGAAVNAVSWTTGGGMRQDAAQHSFFTFRHLFICDPGFVPLREESP